MQRSRSRTRTPPPSRANEAIEIFYGFLNDFLSETEKWERYSGDENLPTNLYFQADSSEFDGEDSKRTNKEQAVRVIKNALQFLQTFAEPLAGIVENTRGEKIEGAALSKSAEDCLDQEDENASTFKRLLTKYQDVPIYVHDVKSWESLGKFRKQISTAEGLTLMTLSRNYDRENPLASVKVVIFVQNLRARNYREIFNSMHVLAHELVHAFRNIDALIFSDHRDWDELVQTPSGDFRITPQRFTCLSTPPLVEELRNKTYYPDAGRQFEYAISGGRCVFSRAAMVFLLPRSGEDDTTFYTEDFGDEEILEVVKNTNMKSLLSLTRGAEPNLQPRLYWSCSKFAHHLHIIVDLKGHRGYKQLVPFEVRLQIGKDSKK